MSVGRVSADGGALEGLGGAADKAGLAAFALDEHFIGKVTVGDNWKLYASGWSTGNGSVSIVGEVSKMAWWAGLGFGVTSLSATGIRTLEGTASTDQFAKNSLMFGMGLLGFPGAVGATIWGGHDLIQHFMGPNDASVVDSYAPYLEPTTFNGGY